MPKSSRKTIKRKRTKRRARKAMFGGYIKRKKPLALKQHNFCERHSSTTALQIGTDAAPGSGMFKQFSIDQIRNASQYMSLFEYYRIDKVVVKFRYKGPGLQTYSGSGDVILHNEQNPVLYIKRDHNDVDSETLNVMKDSMRCKALRFTNNKPEITITLKPAIQTEAYKSALATTYIPKWGQWLSTSDPTVPHYGLKAHCIGPNNTAENGNLDVEFITYFSVKNNE